MRLRPSRILGIAERDLRSELTGRSGWVMAGLMLALLGPAALLPVRDTPELPTLPAAGLIIVSGEVPRVISDLPSVDVVQGSAQAVADFSHDEQGHVLVNTRAVPRAIRRALDAGEPAIRVTEAPIEWHWPSRSLFFALIAASSLTGAISGSLAGERQRKTMQTLLCAAVTAEEIVAGKWLAWVSFAALSSIAAALGALVTGNIQLGPWFFVLPLLPMTTVALGLWLVRGAGDLVSGATASMRIMPAALSILGPSAWWLSQSNPVLGALVPVGGPLMAASGLYDDNIWALGAALLSTICTTWSLLALTTRALGTDPSDLVHARSRWREAISLGLSTVGAAWAPLLAPLGLAFGGNPARALEVDANTILLAQGGFFLTLWLSTTLSSDAWSRPGMRIPSLSALPVGLGLGVLIALSLAQPFSVSPEAWPVLSELLRRTLSTGGTLGGSAWQVAAVLLAICGQELWLRATLQPRLGGVATALLTWLALAPFSPLLGLLLGPGLAIGTRFGGGWVGLLARLSALLWLLWL